MIKSLALSSLVASERNVRRASDPAADTQLAADIAARGLLQNLVVTPARIRGQYAVEAGGRRLRALQALQHDGELPADHKVACLVLGKATDDAGAIEASLAENLQRLAMNPADECLAFGTLIAQGADVAGVARRFGLTVRHVEGRLRLAGLHPEVFAALGAGEITLDAAKAYAATSDQERQFHVFEQLRGAWGGAHPESIRRMMVHATVPASDRRLRFVGEDAYVAAGGRLERDLFADEDDARVLDVAILEQLATDKLEVEAAWLANEHGYAFVRATLDGYVQPWRHEDIRRASIELPGPSEEDRQQVDAVEAEICRLSDILEDEDADDSALQDAEARIGALEADLRAIGAKPPELDPEVRGRVGFFLLLDEAGVPRLDPTPFALIGNQGAGSEDNEGEEDPGSGDRHGSIHAGDASAGPGGYAPATPKLAQRLVDELAMQRRDILAHHLAGDPALAFDLAVFLMAKSGGLDEGGYCFDSAGSSLSARAPGDPVLRSALPEAPVQALLAEADRALDRTWTAPDTLAERFDAFRALPCAAREAWLGAAVARTLEASAGAGGRACPFHDHLAAVIGIDVAALWRPTALNWFDRVPKAVCLAALGEVGGPELAARHAKSKKGEVSEACEKLFAGEGIVEAEVRAAALAWLPDPMRFVRPESTASAPPWSDDEAQVGADPTPGVDQTETIVIGAEQDGDGEPVDAPADKTAVETDDGGSGEPAPELDQAA